ncbi:ISAzo13-like element transposase-related protein, partial [Noviherbaspirillum aerium]
MSPTTVLRGCVELESDLTHCPDDHLRAAGGGRTAAEDKDPELEEALLNVLASESAGDPMGRRAKAKRSSLRHLSQALAEEGHPASRMTVARLLHKLKYSPKANSRRNEVRGASPKERNAQFEHIDEQRSQFKATGAPIISVDTKKIYG